MNNWFIDYHHAHLLRLLSLVIIFGIVWPSLCFVMVTGSRLAKRFAQRITRETQGSQGRTS